MEGSRHFKRIYIRWGTATVAMKAPAELIRNAAGITGLFLNRVK